MTPDYTTSIVISRLSRRLYIEAFSGPSDPMSGRQYRDIRDYVWWLRKNAMPEVMREMWASKGRDN